MKLPVLLSTLSDTAHYPNVRAVAERLVSSNRRTLQQWNAYASNCMKGAQQYFTEKINGELSGLMEAFKAARLFCPQKVIEIKSTVDRAHSAKCCHNTFSFIM